MNNEWKYVNKNENPPKAGRYIVALVYNEYGADGKTGRKRAVIDIRSYLSAKDCPEADSSEIDSTGHVWVTENPGAGGYPEEAVLAWKSLDVAGMPELPGDVAI